MCTKWCPRCHTQAIVLSGVLRVITNPQRYSQRTVCPTEFQLTQASGAIPVLKALVEKYHKSEISYLFDRYFVIIVKILNMFFGPRQLSQKSKYEAMLRKPSPISTEVMASAQRVQQIASTQSAASGVDSVDFTVWESCTREA